MICSALLTDRELSKAEHRADDISLGGPGTEPTDNLSECDMPMSESSSHPPGDGGALGPIFFNNHNNEL